MALSRQMLNLVLVAALASLAIGCSSRRIYHTYTNTHARAAGAININTASADELAALPRIGPKTAEAIIRFRTENGPFRRPEHLMQIRGISKRRFWEIRKLIRTE